MDWTASGITNTFEYELVDPWDFHHLAWLDGVTSCSITEGYYTDSKAECRVETDGAERIGFNALRVWHTAELGDEKYRHLIGTYITDTESSDEKYGSIRRSAHMMAPIDRLSTDLRCGDAAVGRGWGVYDWVRNRVTDGGCIMAPNGSFGNGTFPSSWVWEHGESVLAAINKAANASGGQIGCDEQGRVTLERYVAPNSRPSSFTFKGGDRCIIEPGLKRSTGDLCNRVVVMAEKNGRAYAADARVSESSPLWWRKIGRWCTNAYQEVMDAPNMQQAVDAKAKQYLNQNVARVTKWTVDSLYAPVRCGDIVTVEYEDGGTREVFDAMVQSREFKCDAAMRMKMTLTRDWEGTWNE